MQYVIADIEWYKKQSKEKGVSTHCPFASVDLCPRYYQSLSLLDSTGATKMNERDDKKLFKKWKKGDLWPKIDEHATSVSKPNDKFCMASNYCPEVMYDRFRVFAVSIASFPDEIDQAAMHNHLKKIHAPENDVRWIWNHVEPLHYTDCPLYSVLKNRASIPEKIPWWREHLAKLIVGIVSAIAAALIKLVFG